MNILVIAEHDNQTVKQSSFACLTAALQIAQHTNNNCNLDVLILGYNPNDSLSTVAEAFKSLGYINKLILANNEMYQYALAEDCAKLISDIAKDYQYVLLPATTFGKNIAPRVAAELDVNPLSDVIEIISLDTFKRPIYAGNAIATFKISDNIKLLTIRPTSFDISDQPSIQIMTEILALDTSTNVSSDLAKFVNYEFSKSERPELTSANIVVSGGRGLQSKDNFKLIEDLADKLNAAVGASRAAVDAGFVSNDYQVGQTGKVVAPTLYIAVGISGAIQHLAGIQDSKIIVAINKDSEAPIFKIADYGLVGDLFNIIPELTEKVAALTK
jgi:electron transfer flavoprotein alpha subunit